MLIEVFNIIVTVFGVLMSIAHFPQAMKIIKRKSAKDISIITYSIFTVGAYVWAIYGILINEWPIIITYATACVGTTLVLLLILKYR